MTTRRGRRSGLSETPERLALNLRLPRGGTDRVRAAAAQEGVPLAAWIRRVLLRAADGRQG